MLERYIYLLFEYIIAAVCFLVFLLFDFCRVRRTDMCYVIIGMIVVFGFLWILCAASKNDIGIDECEEQDKWLREYSENKRHQSNKRNT